VPGNALPAALGSRPGQTLPIDTLAPRFEPERHQVYFDLLQRAIDAKGVKNVALTGAYGTGKSSVLERLDNLHGTRVVKLSLSTIAPEVHDHDPGDTETKPSGSRSRTNQIQKEIVKQLLYRLPPQDVPHSRFRRASAPDVHRDRRIAVVAGVAVFTLLIGLGLLQPAVESLLPAVWRQVIAYLLLLALSMAVAWVGVRIIRARPTLSASVQAGAATVTLSKQSESYFDEYLDEIVYFFQASRRDIVVIEDIDRFEDVHVFDTLRALNGLLNASEQIGRRIVFVYAIRDSVFEQIGAGPRVNDDDTKSAPLDHAKATLERANRTKFFDVIIPVVPFVSADNARDVMSEVMTSTEFEIDPALIRLAARHVADMRLIRNIRNEFEIYRNRLVVPENRIPGITDDLVFAIVLYKNTHLADFEKIRHRESSLDDLYKIWRSLVRTNLESQATALTRLRRERHVSSTQSERAARLGHLLTEFASTLAASARAGSSNATVTLAGPATEDNVGQVDTWAEIASGESQQITLQDSNYYRSVALTLSFTAKQLSELLGTPIDEDKWGAADLNAMTKKIAKSDDRLQFLRHHTWRQLHTETDLRVDASTIMLSNPPVQELLGEQSFDEILDAVLRSDLARDLVRHGFLTSHFALYASSYYGNHLGRDALDYIRRCIEPGEPDPTFTLTETDVEQLLREQSADKKDDAPLFDHPSIYNVSILDYLLSQRLEAAARVAQHLAHSAPSDTSFVGTYMQHGHHPEILLALMAPHWRGVVRYAAVDAPVDPEKQPRLLDAVLRGLPSEEYEVDREVGDAFANMYREIEAICRPEARDRAHIVLNLLKASGAELSSLDPLNGDALAVALELRLYPLNEKNLRVLVPEGPVTLDRIASTTTDAYMYALDHLTDYLGLVDSAADFGLLAEPKEFAPVVDDIAKLGDIRLITEFVDRTGIEYRVASFDAVEPAAWPALAAALRTDATWENITAYLDHHGMDTSIAALLTKQRKISDAESQPLDDRRDLAVTILTARDEIPATTTRVALAASLKPGLIPATELKAESSDLVARLLRRRLLADDSATFSAGLLPDWTAHEAAIAASRKYATFVSPDLLPPSLIAKVLRSSTIGHPVRLEVATRLPEFIATANVQQARSIADALVTTKWWLPQTSLDALRAAGATATQIVDLIGMPARERPTSEIKEILRTLGGSYQKVADGGRGRPSFDVTPGNRYVLGRLVGDTIRDVEEDTFKRKGRQLIAPLRAPGA
jgi:hypothetical protein